MAAIPDAVKNALVAKWATDYPYIAVFSSASTTGNNEATGGGYARAQGTPGTANAGAVAFGQVEIPVAAGSYAEGGLFSAASGGNYGGSHGFSGGTVSVSGTGASIKVTVNLSLTGS